MDAIRIDRVEHNSPEYWQTVELRSKVLREPLGLSFSQAELEAESDSIHLAATMGTKVVACLILVVRPEGEFKMRQVAVDFGLQSKGIGRRLVTAAEQICLDGNGALITLHARKSATPFYRALGYESSGDEFEEVGVPHLFMSKRLKASGPADIDR